MKWFDPEAHAVKSREAFNVFSQVLRIAQQAGVSSQDQLSYMLIHLIHDDEIDTQLEFQSLTGFTSMQTEFTKQRLINAGLINSDWSPTSEVQYEMV